MVCKLYSSLLCNILNSSSLIDPNIFLSALFSDTCNFCFSTQKRDYISHPHKNQHLPKIQTITLFWISNSLVIVNFLHNLVGYEFMRGLQMCTYCGIWLQDCKCGCIMVFISRLQRACQTTWLASIWILYRPWYRESLNNTMYLYLHRVISNIWK